MRRRTALFVAALAVGTSALTSLSGTAVATGDRGSSGHGNGRDQPPTLVARATLSADYLAPGPPSGAVATPANGRTGPVPRPGDPRLLRRGRQRRRHLLGACPTTASAPRRNSADFLLRLYLVAPRVGDRPRGGAGRRSRSSDFVSAARPATARSRFPIVNEDTPERLLTGADFDIESLVRAAATARSGSARSSARSCCTSTRPASCSRRRSEFPDGKSPAEPVPAARRDAERRAAAAASRRWPGRATAATSTRSSRARSPTTRRRAAAGSTSSTPARPLHGQALGVPDRHRRQRRRRRLHRSRNSMLL